MQEERREKGLEEVAGRREGGPAWAELCLCLIQVLFNPWWLAIQVLTSEVWSTLGGSDIEDISHMYFLQTCKINI